MGRGSRESWTFSAGSEIYRYFWQMEKGRPREGSQQRAQERQCGLQGTGPVAACPTSNPGSSEGWEPGTGTGGRSTLSSTSFVYPSLTWSLHVCLSPSPSVCLAPHCPHLTPSPHHHPLSCSLSSPLPVTPLFCPSLSLYPPPICAFQFLGSLSLSHSQLASFPRLVFLPTPSSPLTFFFLPIPRCIHAWDPAPQPDQTPVPHTPLIKSVT